MAKVTYDKFGDEMFKQLNRNYVKMDLVEFKKWCCETIDTHSVSSNVKKNSFKEAINSCRDKNYVVKKVTNFFLAGEGLSVL